MGGAFRSRVDAARRTSQRLELPQNPPRLLPALSFVETLLCDPQGGVAFVVEYAETVIPDGDVSFRANRTARCA